MVEQTPVKGLERRVTDGYEIGAFFDEMFEAPGVPGGHVEGS